MTIFNENYIYISDNNISDVNDFSYFINSNRNNLMKSFIIRGQKMKSWNEVFDEFAAALQFPYYFGENLNAFDDCLSDLGWIFEDKIMIFIYNWSSVLSHYVTDKEIFIDHIIEITRYLEKYDKYLRIILLTDKLEKEFLAQNFKKIDVNILKRKIDKTNAR